MDTSEDFASPDAPTSSTRSAPADSNAAPSAMPSQPERSTTPLGPPPIPIGNAQGPADPPSSAMNKGKERADAMDTTSDDGVHDHSPGPAAQNERAPRGRTGEFTRRVGRGQRDSLALAGYSPKGEAPAQGSPLLPRTMVVRDLRRWANAADLEYAIRMLMDSVGERGLGLLRALSVGTGEPDHTGQTPTFDVYFTFDTVRDAALAIENAGRPWVFPTTGRRTRNAPADSRFYAFNIELVSEEAVTEAERGADVLRYPWFSLYAGSTHTARTWDRRALAAQPSYRPPSPRPSEPARPPSTLARQSAAPASTTCTSTEPSSSSSSTSSAALTGGLFEIETRIDFALGTVTISIDDLPRLSQMGVDVASAEARLDLGQGTATLPLDTMVRVFAPRAHSSSAMSHKTLEDRLSDPRRGSRDSETSSDKRKKRRRRGYTPPSTLPGPSRRRTPSPPPPPAALASRIS